MTFTQILLLAIIQGAAELLPISSSAHVIVAEKLMGLDPSSPAMTFLLVMLHTGTMFAVLFYFWPRWKALFSSQHSRKISVISFLKLALLATAITGVLGFGLKLFIEKIILAGTPHAEVEHIFGNLPLMGLSLLSVGILIIAAGLKENKTQNQALNSNRAAWIGLIQGLCLPFRGFSRSGATISIGLMKGISRDLAQDFSFALAVILTPPVILRELHRLLKSTRGTPLTTELFLPGIFGMVFSFAAGLLALKLLSSWIDRGRWKFFGYYCIFASMGVLVISQWMN